MLVSRSIFKGVERIYLTEVLIYELIVTWFGLALINHFQQPRLEFVVFGVLCSIISKLKLFIHLPKLLGQITVSLPFAWLDIPLVLT